METKELKIVIVPARVHCEQDVRDTVDAFQAALDDYVHTHVIPESMQQYYNHPNAGFRIVPRAWIYEFNSWHIEQAKKLIPTIDWDNVIPAQALLNWVAGVLRM
jgi:hypothetical protein